MSIQLPLPLLLSATLFFACSSDQVDESEGADAGLDVDVDRDSECVPTTCSEQLAQCGEIDDGCGGTLDCAGCDGATCIDNSCIVTDCGDEAENECGSCGDLVAPLGSSCPCGTVQTTCSESGWLICDDDNVYNGEKVQPETDDSVDDWTEVVGTLESLANDWDYDGYKVFVDDTFFGNLKASLEVDYDTSEEVRVCISYVKEEDGIVLPTTFIRCSSSDLPEGDTKIAGSGCCLTFPAGSNTVDMEADLDFGLPNYTDGDGSWYISVRQTEEAWEAPVCESYTLRYHF